MIAKRIGWVGIALGVLAFFIAIPPLTVRSPVPIALIALAAITAGAIAVQCGAKRVGWAAVISGLLGVAGGIAATQSGESNLEEVVVWGALLASTLRYATPLTLAALGGLFSERSGVINIALEGMMLMGAFFGAWGADITGSWLLGIVIAVVAGAIFAALHALFAITFRADQIVSGTALNLLAIGITGYMFVAIYGDEGTPDDLPAGAGRAPADQVGPADRRRLRSAQPARVGGARARPRHLGGRVPDPERAAAAVGGREPARGLDRRALGRAHALSRGDDLRRARGDGRRVPVDRVRALLLAADDRGPRASSRSRR